MNMSHIRYVLATLAIIFSVLAYFTPVPLVLAVLCMAVALYF